MSQIKPSNIIADAVMKRVEREKRTGQTSRFATPLDTWISEILHYLDAQKRQIN